MTAPSLSLGGSLRTPLEPALRPVARGDVAAAAQQVVVPVVLGRLHAAAATSCGYQHAANEDAHSALGERSAGVFVVADGVGGGAMAQLASRELVARLHAGLGAQRPSAGDVQRVVLDADRAIAHRIAAVAARPGAATVVLAAPCNAFASRWIVAWVGDCRAYRLRWTGAEPHLDVLTEDDTFRRLGEAPPPGSGPDDPARMVGNGATTGANVVACALPCGDVLALCSDGVHKHLGNGDWRRVLAQGVSLGQRCDDLIAVARANGSVDDATVLLLQRSGLGFAEIGRASSARAAASPGGRP